MNDPTRPSAAQGLEWLREGFALLRRQPLRLLVLGLVLQLLAGFAQVGVLGLVFLLLAPVFGAGMLQAMRVAGRGERPGLGLLFAAFAAPGRLGRLVLLGTLALGFAVVGVSALLAGQLSGLDPELLQRLEAGDAAAVAELDPAMLRGALLALLAGLMVGGTLAYYAVPLAWFDDLPFGRAIVEGLRGMWRAWRPLLVMGLALGLLSLPVAMLMGLNLAGVLPASFPVTLVMLLAVVAFQLLLFATQYVSYLALFGAPGEGGVPEASDQLVA